MRTKGIWSDIQLPHKTKKEKNSHKKEKNHQTQKLIVKKNKRTSNSKPKEFVTTCEKAPALSVKL